MATAVGIVRSKLTLAKVPAGPSQAVATLTFAIIDDPSSIDGMDGA
jgi:hypothetical protein